MGKIIKYKDFVNESVTKYLNIDLEDDFQNCVDLCYSFDVYKETLIFRLYNTYSDSDSTGNTDVDKRIKSKQLELDFYKELKFCLDRYDINNYHVLEYIEVDTDSASYGYLIIEVTFKFKDAITITDDVIYINIKKLSNLIAPNKGVYVNIQTSNECEELIIGMSDRWISNLESIIEDSKLEIIDRLKDSHHPYTLFKVKDKLNRKFTLI